MRSNKLFVVAIALAGCVAVAAQTNKFDGIGKTPTQDEIKKMDLTIYPDGKGLPAGHGSAEEGASIYAAHCAMCHGKTGKEGGPLAPKLIGDTSWERGPVTSWPFAPSIWNYINRAMPRYSERTLTPDQIYAVTAFLLYRSGIIGENDVMDAKTLGAIRMPNRNGWVPANLDDLANLKKRNEINGQYPGPDPTASADTK